MGDYDEEAVPQVWDEEPVAQYDDTIPMTIPVRASTHTDWPPAPPPPGEDELDSVLDELYLIDDSDLAAGTEPGTQPLRRHAGFYAAVRRPTTSNEST